MRAALYAASALALAAVARAEECAGILVENKGQQAGYAFALALSLVATYVFFYWIGFLGAGGTTAGAFKIVRVLFRRKTKVDAPEAGELKNVTVAAPSEPSGSAPSPSSSSKGAEPASAPASGAKPADPAPVPAKSRYIGSNIVIRSRVVA